jgi:uncharacterized protein YaiI (UPF0178 family)
MQIWVDADACPLVIKEILYRAAQRACQQLILVANRPLQVPRSKFIRTVVVPDGLDVADAEIVRQMQPGDLVVTADIPLAAQVVAKGGHALNPRGGLYTEDNIGERLAVRDLLDSLRGSGIETGGPAPLSPANRQAFANQLDRLLTRGSIKS